MAPKVVDKARQQQREKIAEDKTFGLKNKNKSKQVQKYIKSLTSNAAGAPKGGKEQEARDKKATKAADIQKAALMNSLFNMSTDKKGRAFDPVAKKKAKEAEEQAIAGGSKLKEEVRKEIIEGIANSITLTNPKGVRMSELGGHPILQTLKTKHAESFKSISLLLFIKANDKIYWVDDPENNNPLVRCMADVEAEVAPDERPIEEILEERRAALPPGGTPVTKQTFKEWKEKKEAERLAEVEASRQAIIKKDGGKGLVGMSGRDLFTYDATLFVDDDGAASDYDEREEDPDDDDEDNDGKTRGVAAEMAEENDSEEDGDDDDDEDEADKEAIEESGARGSDGQLAGAINQNLFLDEGDLPDDLDDLDEDD